MGAFLLLGLGLVQLLQGFKFLAVATIAQRPLIHHAQPSCSQWGISQFAAIGHHLLSFIRFHHLSGKKLAFQGLPGGICTYVLLCYLC